MQHCRGTDAWQVCDSQALAWFPEVPNKVCSILPPQPSELLYFLPAGFTASGQHCRTLRAQAIISSQLPDTTIRAEHVFYNWNQIHAIHPTADVWPSNTAENWRHPFILSLVFAEAPFSALSHPSSFTHGSVCTLKSQRSQVVWGGNPKIWVVRIPELNWNGSAKAYKLYPHGWPIIPMWMNRQGAEGASGTWNFRDTERDRNERANTNFS